MMLWCDVARCGVWCSRMWAPADGFLVLHNELEQDLEQLPALGEAGFAPLLQQQATAGGRTPDGRQCAPASQQQQRAQGVDTKPRHNCGLKLRITIQQLSHCNLWVGTTFDTNQRIKQSWTAGTDLATCMGASLSPVPLHARAQ